MEKNSRFFTVMHNRVCEQAASTRFFDLAGYGMLGCPMFYRSARMGRQSPIEWRIQRIISQPKPPDMGGTAIF